MYLILKPKRVIFNLWLVIILINPTYTRKNQLYIFFVIIKDISFNITKPFSLQFNQRTYKRVIK